MHTRQLNKWQLTSIIIAGIILPIFSYPSLSEVPRIRIESTSQQVPEAKPQIPHIIPEGRALHQRHEPIYHQSQQALQSIQHNAQEGRKFAEKPNATKKVPATVIEDRNDLDDVQTNQIQQDSGFSWSSVLGTIMQLLFNPATASGPSKSDSSDADQGITQSPWTNLLSVGLKILSAFLGGTPIGGDGIDKVDNSSPMQGFLAAVISTVLGSKDPEQVSTMAKQAGEFINIVVNLLDALKTSFSHRSLAARSLGKKDSVSDAAIASLTLFKGYMRTMRTSDDNCIQKYVCEANKECSDDLNGSNTIYCQLGSYATSIALQRSGTSPFEAYYDAGRKGRSGENCTQAFIACSEAA